MGRHPPVVAHFFIWLGPILGTLTSTPRCSAVFHASTGMAGRPRGNRFEGDVGELCAFARRELFRLARVWRLG